jgi:hypothetical protein
MTRHAAAEAFWHVRMHAAHARESLGLASKPFAAPELHERGGAATKFGNGDAERDDGD